MTQTPTRTPQTPQQTQLPQYEITDDDKKRQQRIALAWQAYNGELEPPLKKMPDSPDDNVMSNRMQAIVDRGVDFLFGKELEISVGENDPQEAQDFLNKTWGRKETRIPLLQKLAMNGANAGSPFLRIVPNRDRSFRLVVVDPSIVFVKTAPQDCETVLLYCIEYCVTEKQNGKPVQVFYREEIARVDPDGDSLQQMTDFDATWQIQHWTKIGERGLWQPAGEPIQWPYEFPPLFSCQNLPNPNDFWGIPDITPDLIGMNEDLNLVQSNICRDLKFYAQPILYATGTGENVIDIKPGKIIGLPLSESKIVAVNLVTDIGNALTFANNLRSDIDEQSSVPGVATGRIADIPRGNISGVAIELLFMPLLKKTDKKRCGYGELIIDVSKALLALNHMSPDIDITLAWQDALPVDGLQNVQALLVKSQIGVSKQTLLEEAGYNPDEELERNQAEDAQKLIDFSRGQGLPPAQEGTPPLPGQPPASQPGQQPAQPQGSMK